MGHRASLVCNMVCVVRAAFKLNAAVLVPPHWKGRHASPLSVLFICSYGLVGILKHYFLDQNLQLLFKSHSHYKQLAKTKLNQVDRSGLELDTKCQPRICSKEGSDCLPRGSGKHRFPLSNNQHTAWGTCAVARVAKCMLLPAEFLRMSS